MKMKYRKSIVLGISILCCGVTLIGVQAIDTEKKSVEVMVEESVSTDIQEGNTENVDETIAVLRNSIPKSTSSFIVSAGAVEETEETEAEESSVNEAEVVTEKSENEAEAVTQEATKENNPEKTNKREKKEKKEPKLVIADVTDYVNIRDRASEEGEIVGKLYDNSVGTLLKKEGDWYYIKSGCVTGYVKGEYVLTGKKAKKRADKVGVRMAKVTTTTLKVRKKPSLKAKVLGLVPEGDLLTVIKEVDGFVKVAVEEGKGYVSTDYVELYTENVVAESIEEEQARLAKEEEERKKAEEAAKKVIGQQTGGNSTVSSSGSEQTASGSASSLALGQKIVDYAVQFVGNPYVYGGTSLTQGADCSGFVMSVYAYFGISLPRTSGEQGQSGRRVESLGEAVPGDLIWYSGHIGIYMGNNRLVHASNRRDGIKISNADYRPILGIRRIV